MAEGTDWAAVWRWLGWIISGGGLIAVPLPALLLALLGGDPYFWQLAGCIGGLVFGGINVSQGVREYRRQRARAVAQIPGLPGPPPSSR